MRFHVGFFFNFASYSLWFAWLAYSLARSLARSPYLCLLVFVCVCVRLCMWCALRVVVAVVDDDDGE